MAFLLFGGFPLRNRHSLIFARVAHFRAGCAEKTIVVEIVWDFNRKHK